MKRVVSTTIDDSGRLVLPESVRAEAGILPGMTLEITVEDGRVEIESTLREIRVVQQGPLWVAVPVEAGEPLRESTVENVLREVRQRGS